MGKRADAIATILTSEIFVKLLNNENIRIAELKAAITLLIKSDIPFDLEFTPGTRRISSQAILTIYINPSTTLSFTIFLDSRGNIIL